MAYVGLFFAGLSMSAYAALYIPKRAPERIIVDKIREENNEN
jgi:hypothetical protein